MSVPLSFQSLVVVVTHPAIVATCGKATATFRPSGVWPVALRPSKLCEPPELPTVGVGQPAIAASAGKAPPAWFGPPFDPSVARGVFHPSCCNSEALSDVGRAEARRAGIDRPDGVALSFQVNLYKVEPTEAVLACNLLAKPDDRAALADEVEHCGP